jgi:hypothetical protein
VLNYVLWDIIDSSLVNIDKVHTNVYVMDEIKKFHMQIDELNVDAKKKKKKKTYKAKKYVK